MTQAYIIRTSKLDLLFRISPLLGGSTVNWVIFHFAVRLLFVVNNVLLLSKQNNAGPNICAATLASECSIDGFQMSIKRPTSGGQARDQEAAVQRTFHLERSSFFYLQTAMVRTQRSAY